MDDIARRTTANTPTLSWLTISLAFPTGPSLCRYLRQCVDDPAALGAAISSSLEHKDHHTIPWTAAQRKALQSPELPARIEQALAWQNAASHNHLLGLDHPLYPATLRDLPEAPPLLYASGSLNALNGPALAIVGARHASYNGSCTAREMAATLAGDGLSIVSGLAVGIDAAAHRGALQALGSTIAIAATAPDIVYPRQHRKLADQILDQDGLILTEYPLGSTLKPWCFPQRNRLISGISLGVLVVEAGLPSGSLTTARHALEQGREVMAMPGSVHHPLSRGCHALIRQGAALVERSSDVLEYLKEPLQGLLQFDRQSATVRPDAAEAADHGDARDDAGDAARDAREAARDATQKVEQDAAEPASQVGSNAGCQPSPDLQLTLAEHRLLDCLEITPNSINWLAQRCNLTTASLAAALSTLEIRGLVRQESPGRYARCKS